MAPRRRYLVVHDIQASTQEAFAPLQQKRFAACPAAAQYADADAQDFLFAAHYMDYSDLKTLVRELQRARIVVPPALAVDQPRLVRHILRRWTDPALREAFLTRTVELGHRELGRLKRRRNLDELLAFVDKYGAPSALTMLRLYGMGDLIPDVAAALSPQQVARQQALLMYAKVTMHHFLTEPEPARESSRLERHLLLRRIRLRDVQLHNMQGSLRSLNGERRSLMSRLREAGRRRETPELNALAAELEQVRRERAEAEQRHADALAEQARRYQEAIEQAKAQLAAAEQDFRTTLALRSTWLPISRRR